MKQLIALVFGISLIVAPAMADENPYAKENESWISLTGKVKTVDNENFTLDYGDGLITVEMDDWDWHSEAEKLNPGERVTVYGKIDDDLYELRTIEAGSVYVFDRSTFFYASATDEEDFLFPFVAFHGMTVPEGSWMTATGTVSDIEGREFTLNTGSAQIQVDTNEMPYNPMDEMGLQKVRAGDRITVSGSLELDFFEQRELRADSIIKMTQDRKKMDSE